jgi:ADP-heptose:LPS heptosyltransferase
MKILLIRLRLVGDVVFTTPIIGAVRAQFPDAHIAYLVEPLAADVVEGNPHLNEIILAPPTRGLARLAGDVQLGRRLRAMAFDLVIDMHGGPRASWLAWATRAPRRIGYRITARSWMYTTVIDRPRELRRRHSVENQWDLLRPLGVGAPSAAHTPTTMCLDRGAALALDERLSKAGVVPGDRLIAIHVSAGNQFRRWPEESFVRLIVGLAERDRRRRFLLTSGPSDRDAAERVAAAARRILGAEGRAVLDAGGDLNLRELRALFDRASLFIGGDSGPLHVAGTTDVPIVAIFGPTLPERSGPWRDRTLVTELVDVGELPCRPCDQRHCAPGDFRCLTGLAPDVVQARAERALVAAMTRPSHERMSGGANAR